MAETSSQKAAAYKALAELYLTAGKFLQSGGIFYSHEDQNSPYLLAFVKFIRELKNDPRQEFSADTVTIPNFYLSLDEDMQEFQGQKVYKYLVALSQKVGGGGIKINPDDSSNDTLFRLAEVLIALDIGGEDLSYAQGDYKRELRNALHFATTGELPSDAANSRQTGNAAGTAGIAEATNVTNTQPNSALSPASIGSVTPITPNSGAEANELSKEEEDEEKAKEKKTLTAKINIQVDQREEEEDDDQEDRPDESDQSHEASKRTSTYQEPQAGSPEGKASLQANAPQSVLRPQSSDKSDLRKEKARVQSATKNSGKIVLQTPEGFRQLAKKLKRIPEEIAKIQETQERAQFAAHRQRLEEQQQQKRLARRRKQRRSSNIGKGAAIGGSAIAAWGLNGLISFDAADAAGFSTIDLIKSIIDFLF